MADWIIYEVNVELDPAVAPAFDAWLAGHIEEVLSSAGFVRADLLALEPLREGPHLGWQRRTIQYRVRSSQDLDVYLEQHAARLRADALQRFGEGVHYERRVLRQVMQRESELIQTARCRNCDARLTAQYCSYCGQRSPVRILTLWGVIKEAAEDLTHSDSRVWRTLRYLLLKPGLLTREYLAGRRARYIPPFRLYLIMSLACFLLIGLDDGRDESGSLDAAVFALDEMTPEAAPPQSIAGGTTASSSASLASTEQAPAADPCDPANWNIAASAGTRERLVEVCRKIRADNGRRFGEALLANVPKMMFVFLPVIALISKLLYPLSKRYYVEHLLFFVHYHAFVFLAFGLLALLGLIGRGIPLVASLEGLFVFAMVICFPLYLYKAMRRVFQQGRAATAIKFVLLSGAYCFCLLVLFIGTVAYTGMSI